MRPKNAMFELFLQFYLLFDDAIDAASSTCLKKFIQHFESASLAFLV